MEVGLLELDVSESIQLLARQLPNDHLPLDVRSILVLLVHDVVDSIDHPIELLLPRWHIELAAPSPDGSLCRSFQNRSVVEVVGRRVTPSLFPLSVILWSMCSRWWRWCWKDDWPFLNLLEDQGFEAWSLAESPPHLVAHVAAQQHRLHLTCLDATGLPLESKGWA